VGSVVDEEGDLCVWVHPLLQRLHIDQISFLSLCSRAYAIE
jgi:hypothetical protein